MRWIRCRIEGAIAIGVAFAGCSDRVVGDPQEGGEDGAGDSTSGSTGADGSTEAMPPVTTADPTSVSVSDGESEADVDDGEDDDTPIFDVGSKLDVSVDPEPPPFDCEVAPPTTGASCESFSQDRGDILVACGEPGPAGCPDAASAGEIVDDCMSCYELYSQWCGPITDEQGSCCYWALVGGGICPGRPFVVDGVPRLAAIVRRDDWCGEVCGGALDDALAHAWLFDARTEHAAIASFARFSLQLLALAAPPRFVEAAHRAALDELAHAQLCFALAARHGARECGPGPLSVEGAFADASDPISIVVATVREGCVAETISAMQLSAACRNATDPWVRARLERMLDQELAHVELAWSFVAWAHARGDADLRTAIRSAFADAWRWIPRGAEVEPAPKDAARWRAAGRLPHSDRLAIAERALVEVVGPLATTLLRGDVTTQADARTS